MGLAYRVAWNANLAHPLSVVQFNITSLEAAEKVIRELLAVDNGLFLGDRNRVIYFLLDDNQISQQMALALWGGTKPPPDTRPKTMNQAISEYGVWLKQQVELAKVVLRNLSETGTPQQVDEQLERYCAESWAQGYAGGVLRLLVRQLREQASGATEIPASEAVRPPSGKARGAIKWFSNEKGFGFIERSDGDDLMFYGAKFEGDPRVLDGGMLVEFDVHERFPGLLEAVNVRALS